MAPGRDVIWDFFVGLGVGIEIRVGLGGVVGHAYSLLTHCAATPPISYPISYPTSYLKHLEAAVQALGHVEQAVVAVLLRPLAVDERACRVVVEQRATLDACGVRGVRVRVRIRVRLGAACRTGG